MNVEFVRRSMNHGIRLLVYWARDSQLSDPANVLRRKSMQRTM